jgi:hypothetical protein
MNSIPVHLMLTGGALTLLAGSFVLLFLLPGLLHWRRLYQLQSTLKALQHRSIDAEGTLTLSPDDLSPAFKKDGRLFHLWQEYRKTLYQAESKPLAWRSSVSAEAFWNGPIVVDSRIGSDFFKHLPGLFTGLGIIGTFAGLIHGLQQFEVSANADTVRSSLESLMHSVGQAFLVSAAAITAAMVTTFIEKLLINTLYGRVDAIAHLLDASFAAAAPEQFLEETALHTQAAAHELQALEPLLRELSEKQMAHQERISQAQADRLGESLALAVSRALESQLAAPMADIKAALLQTHQTQNQAATEMLTHILGQFAQQLDGVLQQQMAGVTSLQQDSAKSSQQLTEQLSQATALLHQGLTQLNLSTQQLAQGMNEGAQQLRSATSEFSQAGTSVGQTLSQFSGTLGQMTTTSESLTQVAAFLYQAGLGLQEGLKDYQSHRDSVALLVNELRALIESAKSDVSITSDVLQRIEQASQGLSTAQQQTQEFMAGVADVLAKAYEDFRISVSNSLNLSNHDFQQTLSSAVGLLSASIKELDDVLAVVPGTPRPPES